MKFLALGLCGMLVHGAVSAELMLEYGERQTPQHTSLVVIVGDGGVAVDTTNGQRAIYNAATNSFYVVDDVAQRSYVLNDKHVQFTALSRTKIFSWREIAVGNGQGGGRA